MNNSRMIKQNAFHVPYKSVKKTKVKKTAIGDKVAHLKQQE